MRMIRLGVLRRLMLRIGVRWILVHRLGIMRMLGVCNRGNQEHGRQQRHDDGVLHACNLTCR